MSRATHSLRPLAWLSPRDAPAHGRRRAAERPGDPPRAEAPPRRLEAERPGLPLPPLSEADKAKMAKANWSGADWSVYNNGRTRKHYLPAGAGRRLRPRADDPAMTLGHRFQTMLFWIVSRANNCTYCMGHQESKLAAAGMDDDQIAALDGDWSEFPARERAAFAFARKLTYEPDDRSTPTTRRAQAASTPTPRSWRSSTPSPTSTR